MPGTPPVWPEKGGGICTALLCGPLVAMSDFAALPAFSRHSLHLGSEQETSDIYVLVFLIKCFSLTLTTSTTEAYIT